MLNRHEYFFDELTIGHGLSALLYSFSNSTPLLINKMQKPHRFSMQEIPFLDTNSALVAWDKLVFILSLSGLIPLADKIESIRLDDGFAKIYTKNFRMIKVNFKKVKIFNDENIHGLPLSKKECEEYTALDWVYARSCDKHDLDLLETGDDFVNKIVFYKSERAANAKVKDMVVFSSLTKEQLSDPEYSDTFVRLKVKNILKEKGIRGSCNGFDTNNPGRKLHFALKLETHKRQIFKNCMDLYSNINNMEFCYDKPVDLLSDFEPKNKYGIKLLEMLA